MGERRIKSGLAAAGILVVLLAVSRAQATEITRPSYREAVEPICKVNTKANERIFTGVKAQVKANKASAAAVQFSKAASALKQTLAQLEAVPQPSADETRLAKWLGYVKSESQLFEATAAKLRAGNMYGAQAMVVRLTHTANLANNEAVAFEFEYCRLEPSRFT